MFVIVKCFSFDRVILPTLAPDVNTDDLAQSFEFAGREIRNAVVLACVSVALAKRDQVTQDDFRKACEKIVNEKKALAEARDHAKGSDIIKKALQERIRKTEEEDIKNASSRND